MLVNMSHGSSGMQVTGNEFRRKFMENIQHPTTNIEHPIRFAMQLALDVGCSMLDVGCCPR
jgi:hypothetical protein